MGSLVNHSCEHQADCDEELVAGDNSTTHSFGCDLRHVQNDDCRDEADAKACNETAWHEEPNSRRRDLKDNSEREDAASENNSGTTANPVGYRASKDSAEECASRENGDNQRLLPGSDVATVTFLGVSIICELRI